MEAIPVEAERRDHPHAPEVQIRPAGEEDFELLHAWDEHISADELRRLLPLGRVLIAGGPEGPRGWLRWGMFWDEIPFLNMLCVREEWRRRGLGARLVRHWEEELRRAGHRAALTSTLASETAQHFYRKLGYADAGGLLLPGEPLELLLFKTL